MQSDLDLFNELIKDETPDCEINEILFAYYSDTFTVEIHKVSETKVGIKAVSMYQVKIAGAINYTRFVNNKENALTKAYMLLNSYLTIKPKEEDISDEEYFRGSRYNTAEFED